MSLFSDWLNSAATVVHGAIDVAADVTKTAISIVKVKYKELKDKYRELDVSARKNDRHQELMDVNDQIIDLERKHRRDGTLSDQDREQLKELYSKRDGLRQKIDNAREYELARDITEHSTDYDAQQVDGDYPNELVRLGGQVVMGKRCSRCNRPMSLRWKATIRDPKLTDLFWGCTGYFLYDPPGSRKRACDGTERLAKEDLMMFGKLGRPGMELPSDKLNGFVLRPEASSHVRARLKDAVGEVTENYLCPVHHEKMELKTKNKASDLLDLYYLKCRRCDQTVKIKSATQLDAVIETYEGGGLFGQT